MAELTRTVSVSRPDVSLPFLGTVACHGRVVDIQYPKGKAFNWLPEVIRTLITARTSHILLVVDYPHHPSPREIFRKQRSRLLLGHPISPRRPLRS